MDEKAERCAAGFCCDDCTSMNFFNAGNCRRLKVAGEFGAIFASTAAGELDTCKLAWWWCWSNELGIDARKGGSGNWGFEIGFSFSIGKTLMPPFVDSTSGPNWWINMISSCQNTH